MASPGGCPRVMSLTTDTPATTPAMPAVSPTTASLKINRRPAAEPAASHAGGSPRARVTPSPGQVGVAPPGVGGAAPRRGRGAAAQLRTGAARVDVQAGGDVLQRAVGLRDELLPRTGVACREDQ